MKRCNRLFSKANMVLMKIKEAKKNTDLYFSEDQQTVDA